MIIEVEAWFLLGGWIGMVEIITIQMKRKVTMLKSHLKVEN